MSRVEDFKVKDRVAHIMIGDGTVTLVDEVGVHVRFDRTRGVSGKKRKHIEGVFDRLWFAANSEYMFHRSK